MERLLQLILERLEQIQQYLFSRRGGSTTQPAQITIPDRIRVQEPLRVISDTGSYVAGEVEITNTPLPVSVSDTPLPVSVNNTPLPVSVSNTSVPVSQSGSWSVSVAGQPISVTVTNSSLTVRYGSVSFATINVTTSGDTQVVPAVSNRRIVVVAYAVVASATVNIRFRSGTTDITGSMRVVEGGGIAHAYDGGLFQTAVGQALNINLSTNATVGGYVVYREV